jgi:hypothetical protein
MNMFMKEPREAGAAAARGVGPVTFGVAGVLASAAPYGPTRERN